MFKIATKAEYTAMSDVEKKAYDAALAAYIAEFRTNYPNGLEATCRITDISLVPIPGRDGKEPTFGFSFSTDNQTVQTQIPQGRMSRPITNANIMAQRAGFSNWPHMALVLKSVPDKGAFKVRFDVHVKGEKYGEGLKAGTYTSTSFAQVDFEYVPSAAISARYAKLTEKAATRGFEDLLYAGANAGTANAPVAADAGTPDADI